VNIEPLKIHTRSEEQKLFRNLEIDALARDLRRRRSEATSQLDIEATIHRTTERAGLLTPVTRERRTAREYLVLAETKGRNDQQTQLWNCLLDRLAGRDVYIDRYWFSG